MSNRQRSKLSCALFGHIRSVKHGSVKLQKDSMAKRYDVSKFSFNIVPVNSPSDGQSRHANALVALRPKGWTVERVGEGSFQYHLISHPDFSVTAYMTMPSPSGQFSVSVNG